MGGRPVHYVSYKRNAFFPMKLPKYILPKVGWKYYVEYYYYPVMNPVKNCFDIITLLKKICSCFSCFSKANFNKINIQILNRKYIYIDSIFK